MRPPMTSTASDSPTPSQLGPDGQADTFLRRHDLENVIEVENLLGGRPKYVGTLPRSDDCAGQRAGGCGGQASRSGRGSVAVRESPAQRPPEATVAAFRRTPVAPHAGMPTARATNLADTQSRVRVSVTFRGSWLPSRSGRPPPMTMLFLLLSGNIVERSTDL